MPELSPDQPTSTDETAQSVAGQPEHAEPTEQPDEEDEPQAGSPS